MARSSRNRGTSRYHSSQPSFQAGDFESIKIPAMNSYSSIGERLKQLEDLRRWTPTKLVRKTLRSAIVRFVDKPYGLDKLKTRMAVYDVRKTIFCVRRKIRRQVLFALGVGGRGGQSKKHRWNEDSYYSCKRR